MPKQFKKCECGSTRFILGESTCHRADLEDGKLWLSHEEACGFDDEMECDKCGKKHNVPDIEIEY